MDLQRRLRIGLVSTSAVAEPGSMRAYADLLTLALARHAPELEVRTFELDPEPPRGGIAWRCNMLSLPLRAKRLRREAIDVWHVLDGSRAYITSSLGPSPVVITAHDIIPRLQRQGRFPGAPNVGCAAGWLWQRNGKALQQAQGVICVSDCTRIDLEAEFRAGARSRVVPLPIRPELALLASHAVVSERDEGIVLHVGNNSFYKNREVVLRIYARTERRMARQLWMVGAAPTDALISMAEQLGITTSVHWFQDADDAVLADCYRRASVLVFPSLYEGFGWPPLEAMSFGLPVVCSNAGSLPEVVGDAAPCINPMDSAGFVEAVEALLCDPELRRQRATAGRARVAKFGLQQFALETANSYRAALGIAPVTYGNAVSGAKTS